MEKGWEEGRKEEMEGWREDGYPNFETWLRP